MIVTVKDYAARKGVSEEAVRRKIRRGTLQARKMGRDWILDDDTPYIDHRRKHKRRK